MKEKVVFFIMKQLKQKEMHAQELALKIRTKSPDALTYDGEIFSGLLELERTKQVISFRAKTNDGKIRRYYKMTPLGLQSLMEYRASDGGEDTKQVSPSDVSLDAIPSKVASGLKRKKMQKRFGTDIAEFIEDDLAYKQSIGMSLDEAKQDILKSFGSPHDIATDLQRVLDERKKPKEFRKPLVSTVIGIVSLLALVGLYFLWGIFVVEAVLLVLGLFAFLYLLSVLRVFKKRRRAFKKIVKAARENGYTVTVLQKTWSSVFKIKDTPTLLVSKDTLVYKVRFVPAWQRARILKFLSPYLYQIVDLRGIGLAMTRSPIRFAWHFKPKGVAGTNFHITHSDIVQYEKAFCHIPLYEKRLDNQDTTVKEVLLFNPVPMKATYRNGTVDETLIGGETKDNVLFHDVPGFCNYLGKNT